MLEGHSEAVTCLVAPAFGQLVSGSFDRTIRVWDLATSRCVTVLASHSNWVYCLVALEGGRIASGGADKTILVRHGSGSA